MAAMMNTALEEVMKFSVRIVNSSEVFRGIVDTDDPIVRKKMTDNVGVTWTPPPPHSYPPDPGSLPFFVMMMMILLQRLRSKLEAMLDSHQPRPGGMSIKKLVWASFLGDSSISPKPGVKGEEALHPKDPKTPAGWATDQSVDTHFDSGAETYGCAHYLDALFHPVAQA